MVTRLQINHARRVETHALRRGRVLGAITSVVTELNVVIGELKHNNTAGPADAVTFCQRL